MTNSSGPRGATRRFGKLGDGSSPHAGDGESRLGLCVFATSVVIAVLPITVAVAGAIHRRWIPTGDNAIFAIRARDVFTTHPPLLGAWTSAALMTKTNFNNPGPLLFDALAVPTRFFGGSGLAVGVALLNCLAVVGIAIFAYRRGGPLLGTAAMATVAALGWSMGSEVLFDAQAPSSLVLPFLCFVMLIWSITCCDLAAIPWALGLGSLLVEAYLVYAYLVPLLMTWAAIGLILELRRRRGDASWQALRRRLVRIGAVAGLVLVACWAQPLVEQFTSDGPGNLGRLLSEIGDPALRSVGFARGTQFVAQVVALPPWWFRPSFRGTLEFGGSATPSLGGAVASLTVVTALLAGCAWDARRRRDREVMSAVVTATVAVFAGVVTAGLVAVGPFGPTFHVFTWLWPIGAFMFFAVVATIVRHLEHVQRRSVPLVGALMVSAVVFAVLNLPSTNHGASSDPSAIPVARAIDRQLGSLTGKGPILIDHLYGGRFADPYGPAVIAELQRRGISFVTADSVLVRQFGSARRFNGRNARSALFLQVGNDRTAAPAGTPRVAHYEGLTSTQQRQLAAVKQQLAVYIREGDLRLNRTGEAALASGHLPVLSNQLAIGRTDPDSLFGSGELVQMVRDGDLTLRSPWLGRFELFGTLQTLSDDHTVSLYLTSRP